MLEKKNELIAILEEEIREADQHYKVLIEEFHQNVSVLSSRLLNAIDTELQHLKLLFFPRMESQIQALETLIVSERGKIELEFEKQRAELKEKHENTWQEKVCAHSKHFLIIHSLCL